MHASRGSWGVVGRILVLPVTVVVGIGIQPRVGVGVLTVDPATQAGLPPWTGAISTAGILMWCVGAVCGIIAGTTSRSSSRDPRASCALDFGCLSAWLCVDDAFLVHDALGPRVLSVPELVVIGAEALWLGLLLVRHRDVLRREEPVLFAIAIACFGASVVSDMIPTDTDVPGLWRLATYLVEDGFKWVGICVLTAWLVRLSRRVLGSPAQPSDRIHSNGVAWRDDVRTEQEHS